MYVLPDTHAVRIFRHRMEYILSMAHVHTGINIPFPLLPNDSQGPGGFIFSLTPTLDYMIGEMRRQLYLLWE